jgi:hypothetical protein
MKLGRNPYTVNRTREALKLKGKRKNEFDAYRAMGLTSDSLNTYPSILKMPIIRSTRYGENEPKGPVRSNVRPGTSVEMAFKFPYDDHHRFHVNVWRECSDTFSRATMAVTSSTCQDITDPFEKEIIFLFNNKKDVEEAQAWWDSYRARFHDMTKTFLPRFANGQELTGYALEIVQAESTGKYDIESKSGETDFFSEWVWLVQHTSDRVYWSKHFWFFENQAEMVQFKLSGDLPQLQRQVF